jgi:hypothetical protein
MLLNFLNNIILMENCKNKFKKIIANIAACQLPNCRQEAYQLLMG